MSEKIVIRGAVIQGRILPNAYRDTYEMDRALAAATVSVLVRSGIDAFIECLAGAGPEWVGAIPDDALDLARDSAIELVVGEMMDTEDLEDGA